MLQNVSGGTGQGTGGTSFDANTLNFPGVPYSANDMNDNNCNTQSGNIENYGDKYQAKSSKFNNFTIQFTMQFAKKTLLQL